MKIKKQYGRVIRPTNYEVLDRFHDELSRRIENRISKLAKDKGVVMWAKINTEFGEKFRVQEKWKMLKEWEAKGKRLSFLELTGESWMELCGKHSRYEAEEMIATYLGVNGT